jgi:hypothetical protein
MKKIMQGNTNFYDMKSFVQFVTKINFPKNVTLVNYFFVLNSEVKVAF